MFISSRCSPRCKFYGIATVGRPTLFIGSKNGVIPHILRKTPCEFSIKKGEAEEVSRIIQELADHQETCLRLGRRVRAQFDQQFDMRYAIQAWGARIASTANPILSV